MPHLRQRVLPVILLTLILTISLGSNSALSAPNIVVGAGPDNHQQLLTEMVVILLAKEGVTTEIKYNMNLADLPALLASGDIDFCFQKLPQPSAESAPGIVNLPPLTYATGPVLLMRTTDAKAQGVETISHLAELIKKTPAKLRLADMNGTEAKQLATIYGLPTTVTNLLSSPMPYLSLKRSKADIALGQADDGRIVAFRLRPLIDDRHALPELRNTPLVRQTAIARFPALSKALASLREHLDTETMRRLHGAIIIAHRKPGIVAREWLQKEKLLNH